GPSRWRRPPPRTGRWRPDAPWARSSSPSPSEPSRGGTGRARAGPARCSRRAVEDLPEDRGECLGFAGLAVFAAEEAAVAVGEDDRLDAQALGHGAGGASGKLLPRLGADPDHDAGRGGPQGVEVVPVEGAG